MKTTKVLRDLFKSEGIVAVAGAYDGVSAKIVETTGTLNITGRMGSNDSKIFLASDLSIAASAIEGRTADPRRFL